MKNNDKLDAYIGSFVETDRLSRVREKKMNSLRIQKPFDWEMISESHPNPS
jgi:hypothetical protein